MSNERAVQAIEWVPTAVTRPYTHHVTQYRDIVTTSMASKTLERLSN